MLWAEGIVQLKKTMGPFAHSLFVYLKRLDDI